MASCTLSKLVFSTPVAFSGWCSIWWKLDCSALWWSGWHQDQGRYHRYASVVHRRYMHHMDGGLDMVICGGSHSLSAHRSMKRKIGTIDQLIYAFAAKLYSFSLLELFLSLISANKWECQCRVRWIKCNTWELSLPRASVALFHGQPEFQRFQLCLSWRQTSLSSWKYFPKISVFGQI